MTCACGRENHAARRYCGACGVRLGASCARCHFDNAVDDHHCGGCGDALERHAGAVPPVPRAAALPAPPAVGDTMSAAELASLLGSAEPPAPLPTVVSQDDLDRLFGGLS